MIITAIVLTANQAETIRGTYNEIASLEPVPVGDGRFFLPLAVLNDPNFAEVHEILSALPIEEIILINPSPDLTP